MNKLLLEHFARQAGLSYMPSTHADIADQYKGTDAELSAFAESIVQECLSIISTLAVANAYHEGCKTPAYAQSNAHILEIMDHFSISEFHRKTAVELSTLKAQTRALKLGDRVKIIGRPIGGCFEISGEIGTVHTIDMIEFDFKYQVNGWWYMQEQLELVEGE